MEIQILILNFQVIAAEGEKTASVALRAASDNIAGNHAAMQLRYNLYSESSNLIETSLQIPTNSQLNFL